MYPSTKSRYGMFPSPPKVLVLLCSQPIPLTPRQRQPIFWSVSPGIGFACFKFTSMKSYSLYTTVAGFCSTKQLDSEVAIVSAVCSFFVFLCNILLYELYPIFCLPILLLINICVVLIWGLLWINLLETFLYKDFCWHVHLLILGICSAVEWLRYKVGCLPFLDTAMLFPKVVVPFYTPTNNIQTFPLLPLPKLGTATLNFGHSGREGVRSHCGVVGISLVSNDVEHLSTCL